MARKRKRFEICPFTIVRDTRENAPYSFQGLRCDSRQSRLPLVVNYIDHGLITGDYSINGLMANVSIERKSKEDLFSTLGQGRERFEREVVRLQQLEFAAVVVEAEWQSILERPPPHSKLSPKTVFRTVLAWSQRYYRVHWFFLPHRRAAEICCFRLLERFWRDTEDQKRESEG